MVGQNPITLEFGMYYKSGADIIVLLNNDMRFSKKWLINTLEIFNKEKNVGMAGCEVITDKNKFEEFSAKKNTNGH